MIEKVNHNVRKASVRMDFGEGVEKIVPRGGGKPSSFDLLSCQQAITDQPEGLMLDFAVRKVELSGRPGSGLYPSGSSDSQDQIAILFILLSCQRILPAFANPSESRALTLWLRPCCARLFCGLFRVSVISVVSP
ncbi:MAG: hypothetical protein JXA87_09460 [Thermoleophilia bacterium]|nr:hypothetical protein [Thermoleophilia bacterium]